MCAAPLRPRAVFCHRCGKPYPEESAVVYKQKESQSNAPTTEEFEAQWNTLTNVNGNSQIAEIESPEPALSESEIEENTSAGKTADAPEGAQTAADKKQRVRRRVVHTTEYVWEETATDPTWRFVAATIVVLIFAFFILWFGGFIRF